MLLPAHPISPELRRLLDAYEPLLAAAARNELDEDGRVHLALIEDVICEAGIKTVPPPATPAAWLGIRGELGRVSAALLRLHGIPVLQRPDGPVTPAAVAAEPGLLDPALVSCPEVPVVLVNVSGPDAVMGNLRRARVARYLRRPVSPFHVLEGVAAIVDGVVARRASRRSA